MLQFLSMFTLTVEELSANGLPLINAKFASLGLNKSVFYFLEHLVFFRVSINVFFFFLVEFPVSISDVFLLL